MQPNKINKYIFFKGYDILLQKQAQGDAGGTHITVFSERLPTLEGGIH